MGETNYHTDDEFEGNETIDIAPANVQDGWEETMPEDFDDNVSETAVSESYGGRTMPHYGENTIRVSEDIYSRPTFDTTAMTGEGPYSPSSVAYETDIDSPTACYEEKRGPRSISSYASTPTAYHFNEFNSQDLSGFATLSPSASVSASTHFFPKRGIKKDQSLQTEQLERDWVVAQNARLKNEKKMLQTFSTQSLNLDDKKFMENDL